jgi:hypothetical protein
MWQGNGAPLALGGKDWAPYKAAAANSAPIEKRSRAERMAAFT